MTDEAKTWPEGSISAKVTMNPYVFAMAMDEAYKQGMKPWEYINLAMWEKLGQPDHDTLMQYAANIEVDEEDPKWRKRLKITARHEIAVGEAKKELAGTAAENSDLHSDNGGEQNTQS
jgi:hypothetical protein